MTHVQKIMYTSVGHRGHIYFDMGDKTAASFKEKFPGKHLTKAFIFINMKNNFIQMVSQSKNLLLLPLCVLSEDRNRASSGMSTEF
jgi:hypothetical protein